MKINIALLKQAGINLDDPRVQPLDQDLLISMSKEAVDGNLRARERVLNSLTKMIVLEAGQRCKFDQSDLVDLIQEGMLGACEAIDRFEPGREVKFTSYASWWIKARMLKTVIDQFSLVKIGTTQAQRKLFYRMKKEQRKLSKAGIEADPKAVADVCDVDIADVELMQDRFDNPVVSGDVVIKPGGNASNGATLFDSLESGDNPEANTSAKVSYEWLHAMGDAFYQDRISKATERAVWNHRVLPTTGDPMKLVDLGDLLGLTRQRVDQIAGKLSTQFKKYAAQRV